MATQQPAYASYLMPTQTDSIISPQLGNDYLSNLENNLNLNEQQQMNQLLAQQNMSGALNSGNTNFGLAQISGNTQNQFADAFTNLSNQAATQQQNQSFNTASEQQQFQNQLAQMAQQVHNQQLLDIMQQQMGIGQFASPQRPSFGQLFGQSVAGAIPGAIINSGVGAFNSLLGGSPNNAPSYTTNQEYQDAFQFPYQSYSQLGTGGLNLPF